MVDKTILFDLSVKFPYVMSYVLEAHLNENYKGVYIQFSTCQVKNNHLKAYPF